MSDVTLYSQRDPRWAAVKLGASANTIGQFGCLLTAYASMITDAGQPMTPDQLDTALLDKHGFASGDLIVHQVLARIAPVQLLAVLNTPDPASTPVALFEWVLGRGGFVVVQVDFDPNAKGVQEHWVRLLSDGQCMDPWDGTLKPISPRFGQCPTLAIWRAILFAKLGAPEHA